MKKLTSFLCAVYISMSVFQAGAMLRMTFRSLCAAGEGEGIPRLVRGLRTLGREGFKTTIMGNTNMKLSTWSEEESRLFVKYGNCFTPEREKQINILTELIPHENNKKIEVVELCSGCGLISKAILNKFPQAHLTAMDLSETMLHETSKTLSEFKGRFKTRKFNLSDKCWRNYFEKPIDVFVSSLAIHHLNDKEKLHLFKDLYSNLNIRGAFLIADLIKPNSTIGFKLAAKYWDESTFFRSKDLLGNEEGYDAFQKLEWNYFRYPEDDPIDKPSPILDQLKWLEEAGFEGVDVFWLNAGHAIYGGYKS